MIDTLKNYTNNLIKKTKNRDLMHLDRVEEYLKEKGIKYTRYDELRSAHVEWIDRHQIAVPSLKEGEYQWDVICHFGSYGGDEGLLEIMGCIVNQEKVGDSVEGYLTSDEVIERVERYDEITKNRS